MPKEIINSQFYGMSVPTEDGKEEVLLNEPTLHIGWMRDCNVEVAVLKKGDAAGGGYPPAGATPENGTGWFIQLDRAGINRAIRALRKARDQAFGSDA